MTEEEKKAIEKIKELEKLTREESKERNLKETQKLYKEYADYYLIILNLIEKLQKENEELKLKDYYLPAWVTKKYVSKDKIREKIEDYKNEIECEKSYLEQGIICEEEYKDRVKVYNSYIFILNKLLEEE